MNRKKKVIQILKAKAKKGNAKKQKSNKPRYISKAERAKMEAEQTANSDQTEVVEATEVEEATAENETR